MFLAKKSLYPRLACCLTLLFLAGRSFVFSATKEECERLESQDLSQGISCWQELLSETKSQKNSLEREVSRYNSSISLTTANLVKSQNEIHRLIEEIDRLDTRIGLLDQSLDAISNLFIERISATYKTSRRNPFWLLFSSQNFTNFINRRKYLGIAQIHDRKILLQLQSSRLSYDEQKRLKTAKQTELEEAESKYLAQKIVLAQQKQEKEYLLGVTKSNEKVFQELLVTAQAEQAAIEATMRQSAFLLKDGTPINAGDAIAVIGNTGAPCCSTAVHLHFEVRLNDLAQNPANYLRPIDVIWDNAPDPQFGFSGSWDWPVSSPRLTQGFGDTYWSRLGWYGGGPHNGLDLTSPSSIIKSPQSGILYKGQTTCGRGCPIKYVAVDHGNGLVSWYWHVQ